MKSLFLVFFLSLSFLFATAQLNSIPNNLGNVKSSDISNEQVSQLVVQMHKNNLTYTQVYQLLLQRGMSAKEATALRNRLENYVPAESSENEDTQEQTSSTTRTNAEPVNNTTQISNPDKIFGLEIFNNGVLTFEPNLKIATPANYIIGPDDEISITIYGYQEAHYNLVVSPEGDINIPLIGVVYVSGLTIEQASAKIKSKLASSGYSNIKTGLTKVNIGIGKIRSIHITVLGEVVKPGTYTIPSLATAFNALYLSGGPNNIGSMRSIEIIRNGKVVETLDIYDFLVKGDQSGNIGLRDQDIIRVPPYKTRVSVDGEVKRTGLFEVVPGETFQDVLNFAGGFTDSAYTASVKVYKVTDTEKRITDITKDQFSTYKPSRAETYVVRKIIDRYTNRVVINGAVYLPGEYELTEGMTISGIIRKAQGLREDAYRGRGLILRYKEDLTTELLQFNPGAVITGREPDIVLKRNDEVSISSVLDMRSIDSVSINGQVRRPGKVPYYENMSLKDLILLSGGLTDAAAPQKIEVARRVRKDSLNIYDLEIAQILEISSALQLNTMAGDIKLQPWDVVQVRKNPGYKSQISVRIDGEIIYPGDYVIESRIETVTDLIKRAGGVTPQAYLKGAYLSRLNNTQNLKDENLTRIKKIQKATRDTSNQILADISAPTVKIALNLEYIIKHPHSDEDIVLQEGDVVIIDRRLYEVKVSGEVMFPTQVVFKEGADLRYYIDKAGGFTENARKRKTYVLYGNGNASKTKRILFFKNYPEIEPGVEILVPKYPERPRGRLSTSEIVAITTGIASLVGVVVALFNYLK